MADEKSSPKKEVLRETDNDARLLARRLLREARHAAIATLEPVTGDPLASRVAVANLMDGTPLILVSDLSGHTSALRHDPRASLLLGEPGKGDPLAHPRMSVSCHAIFLERGNDARETARARFLNRHPKAALYADFGDFHFIRLDVSKASLNAGFGRAYALQASDMIAAPSLPYSDFAAMEEDVISHMNADHASALSAYAVHVGREPGPWQMTGIDPEGFDLAIQHETARINFPQPLQSAIEIRPALVALAKSPDQL